MACVNAGLGDKERASSYITQSLKVPTPAHSHCAAWVSGEPVLFEGIELVVGVGAVRITVGATAAKRPQAQPLPAHAKILGGLPLVAVATFGPTCTILKARNALVQILVILDQFLKGHRLLSCTAAPRRRLAVTA